jgi:anti-sigma regulatory factor (Ser/Thr protein kinase)
LSDEIDENDWAQIKVVIEEGLNNIMTFRKDEGVSLERISIAYWEYSTVHD